MIVTGSYVYRSLGSTPNISRLYVSGMTTRRQGLQEDWALDLQLGLFPDEALRLAAAPVSAVDHSARQSEIANKLPVKLRLGTSSWSFPGWEGIVYDRRVSQQTLASHGLTAYAQHPLLRTVGVDRTFYRPISSDAFRAYADAVPADFRFLVKADRLLTSPTDPEGYGVRGPNPRFLDPRYAANEVIGPMIDGLGCKAGPLLFQFPPIPPNLVGGRGPFIDPAARVPRRAAEGSAVRDRATYGGVSHRFVFEGASRRWRGALLFGASRDGFARAATGLGAGVSTTGPRHALDVALRAALRGR